MAPLCEDAPRLRDEEGLPLMVAAQQQAHQQHQQHQQNQLLLATATQAQRNADTPHQQLSRSSSGAGSTSKDHALPLLQRVRARLRGFTPELLAITLVYFVQGILKLSSLAVTFFLKDELKLEPTQMALVDTITAVPWTVKPLYGFITDSFPIAGMRRRPYLILAGLTGCLAWLAMACMAHSLGVAMACMTAAAASTAFSDVVADSIVVQLARASPGATEGALQSMCWGAHAFGRLITAYLSGWLVGRAGPRPVFLATATFPLIVVASSCLIQESSKGGGGGSNGGSDGRAGTAGGDAEEGEGQQERQRLLGASSAAADEPGGAGGAGKQHPRVPLGAEMAVLPAGLPPAAAAAAAAAGGGGGSRAGSSGSGSGSGGRQHPPDDAAVLLLSGHLTAHGQNGLQHKHRHHQQQPSTPPPSQSPSQQQQRDQWQSPFVPGSLQERWSAQAALDQAAHSESRMGSGSGGRPKPRQCLQEAWASVRMSVGLFWGAIRQPHMLRPVMFLFLMQAMPQPDSAMFFFKTNKLGFDAEFFGRVKLVAALADLVGLAVYNTWLKAARLRPLMLWGGLLGCGVGLTPLLLVEGVNRQLGVSDRVFALVDSALLASIGQVLMMPTLVLSARLCPEGVEATLYASLMSLNNAASGVASATGAGMMQLFGITSSNFDHLSALLLTCNLLSLLPLPLVGWVPDETPKAAAAAASAAAAAAAEEEEAGRRADGRSSNSGRPGVELADRAADRV